MQPDALKDLIDISVKIARNTSRVRFNDNERKEIELLIE